MTNLQLLPVIGVPTLFVLAGILLNHREVTNLKADMNRQFDKFDARFDKVDAKFDKVDAHLARIDEDLRMFSRHG